MTKAEAIDSIDKGLVIKHPNLKGFLKKCPKSTKHFIDHNGNVIDRRTFWRYRTQPKWQVGWLLKV